MPEPAQAEQSPVAVSFAEHIRAFYQSLRPEERTLLEQVFALAEAASRERADVRGYDVAASLGFLAGFQWGPGNPTDYNWRPDSYQAPQNSPRQT